MKKVLARKFSAVTLASLVIIGFFLLTPVRAGTLQNVPTHTYVDMELDATNVPTHTYVPLHSNTTNVPVQDYVPMEKKSANTPTHQYVDVPTMSTNIPTNSYVPYTVDKTNIPSNVYVPFSAEKTNIPTHSYSSFGAFQGSSTMPQYTYTTTSGPTTFGTGAAPLQARSQTSPLPSVRAGYTTSTSSSVRSDYNFDIDSSDSLLPLQRERVVSQTSKVSKQRSYDLGDTSSKVMQSPLTRKDLAIITWSLYKDRILSEGQTVKNSVLPIIGDVLNTDPAYQIYVDVAAKDLVYMMHTIVEYGKLVYAEATPYEYAPVGQIMQSLYKALGRSPSTKPVYTYTDITENDWYAPYMYDAHAKEYLAPTCTGRVCAGLPFGSLTKEQVLDVVDLMLQD